jgi:hypothetical protein
LSPGEELRATLFWQSTQAVEPSYIAFVHLLDSAGQLRTQSDHIPNGDTPTYAWSPGEVVPDLHVIHLDESIPTGEYMLVAGMYDSSTQERLPRLSSSGAFEQDNVVFIGKVSIE